MAIRVNLTYTIQTGDPGVTELTFNMPNNAVMNQATRFLFASSPNTGPILLTSGDTSKVEIVLENSVYYAIFKDTGNVVLTATQGSDVKNITVNISQKAAPAGRTFTVGTPGTNLQIIGTNTSLFPGGLQAGDTVIINPGRYSSIEIKNIMIPGNNISNPVVICNGPGLVETKDGAWVWENLRNVYVDGSRAPGIMYGMLSRDNGYMASYVREEIDYFTLTNFEWRNNTNNAIRWEYTPGTRNYDGTLNNVYVGNKFLNLKLDNCGSIGAPGSVSNNNAYPVEGLNWDLRYENIEVINTSAGSVIYVGAGQDVVFKNIHLDNINPLNNNHNGIFFCSGTADVINCTVRNFEGNLIRLWTHTIIDGVLGGRTTPKKCLFYGNIAYSSRKYGMFECQSFDYYDIPGVTSYADVDIFHNTCGEMNKNNNPVVFTGKLYDNYFLHGGTVRLFNNIQINGVGSSNNRYITYGSPAQDGMEVQTGSEQEFSNVSYNSAAQGFIDEGSLSPKVGSSARVPGVTNSSTALMVNDLYGNPNQHWKGAVQAGPMQLPNAVAVPTKPSIAQWWSQWSGGTAQETMITTDKSFSPVGIKNYDMERNGVVTTTRTGNPRDGRPDPTVDSDFDNNTTYQWRFRGRDWLDQVGPWSDRIVHRMPGVALGTATNIILTKTSGGTLTGTPGGTYSATGSTVYCSTGIAIGPNEAVRITFDNNNTGTNWILPYIGWATTSTITSLSQMQAGISSNQANSSDNYQLLITNGVARRHEYIQSTSQPSLYIGYDGWSWYEVQLQGENHWRDAANVTYVMNNELSGIAPFTGTKYLVVIIPVGTQVKNLKIASYPSIT